MNEMHTERIDRREALRRALFGATLLAGLGGPPAKAAPTAKARAVIQIWL